MPAPPYCCGTDTPSRPSFAMPPSTRSRSNRCCRSLSWMCGAISRAAHSRTDCSSRRCSSVRSKLIIRKREILSCAPQDLHGGAAACAQLAGRARAVGSDLQMIGAAEQRADLSRAGVGVRRNDSLHLARPDTDLQRAVMREPVEHLAIDVGN